MLLRRYKHEAVFNHLADSSHEELKLVEGFTRIIQEVVLETHEPDEPGSWLLSWKDWTRLAPDFGGRLVACVDG